MKITSSVLSSRDQSDRSYKNLKWYKGGEQFSFRWSILYVHLRYILIKTRKDITIGQ